MKSPVARRKRRYYPHIYFESKKPGRDSVYAAVPGHREARVYAQAGK